MEPERWKQLEQMFHDLLGVAEPERTRVLDARCGADDQLRRELASLLSNYSLEGDAAIGEIVGAAADQLSRQVNATAVGRRVGPYRLVSLLGTGGMGAVYLAERDDTEFVRKVAIKFVLHAIASPHAIARFRDERQILAALHHPNIVRLLDGGTDDGLPYLVMEHIEGIPITAYARQHELSVRDRLELVRTLCNALQYAHQHLVIHRDIKPSNILVDTVGTPKLLDFGIAKLIAPLESFERQRSTRTGVAPFTPEYASPEQARGEAVSTATDVYSLGAVLYELLTDEPRHRANRSMSEMLRLVCEVDPVRPSSIAPRARRGELAGDLDNIVLKALHLEPARRYASAEQLSDDLKRYLAGLPVHARIATAGYRARKFVRRNRAGVFATALIAGSLVAATVVALRQAQHADAAARRATIDRQHARDMTTELLARNDAQVLMQARAELTRDPTAALGWLNRYPETAPGQEEVVAIAGDAVARGVAHDVWDLGMPLASVSFSPDGRTLGVSGGDRLVFIDVATGARRTYRADDGTGGAIVFSPDGATVATTDGHQVVRLWNVVTGSNRRLAGAGGGGANIQFSADGSILLVRHSGRGSQLWRLPGGEPLPLPGTTGPLIAFVKGGRRLAVAQGRVLSLVDPHTGERRAQATVTSPPYDLWASADGRWIAASQFDALEVWNAETGAVRRIVPGVASVALITPSPTGAGFMSCGHAATELWFFDAADGSSRRVSADERCSRRAFSFSPDGSVFVSTGFGGEIRLHLLARDEARILNGHRDAVTDATFSPDGATLATVSADHTVRLWRWAAGDVRLMHGLRRLDRPVGDGKMIVERMGGGLEIADLQAGTTSRIDGAPPHPHHALLSASGHVVVSSDDGTLWIADLNTGARRTMATPGGLDLAGQSSAGLSPDGNSLVSVDRDGQVQALDLGSATLRQLGKLSDVALATGISSDGRWLATGGRDGRLHVFAIATGGVVADIAFVAMIWDVSLAPDGTSVAAACGDGLVRVLDVASGRVRELRGHLGAVSGVDFTDDSRTVISGGADGTARAWNLGSGLGVVIHREAAPIIGIDAIRGTRLAVTVTSRGRSLRVWDTSRTLLGAGARAQARTWLQSVTTARVDAAGRLATP